MDFLLDPNVAYLVLLVGILLSMLAIVTPGTGLLEVGAFFGLVLAGYAIYNLNINFWALIVILLTWSAITLAKGQYQTVPLPTADNLKFSDEAPGFLKHSFRGEDLPKMFGLFGILIAFGHSVLAMSGEESLAQVNRELEYPKHRNLMRAGLIIFLYSMLFTSLVSFFAYAIIPDDVRPQYFDNLISGIAINLAGPTSLKLVFQAFIVIVGFLMLASARRLPFDDYTELFPAIATIALMAFTYNIGFGMAAQGVEAVGLEHLGVAHPQL